MPALITILLYSIIFLYGIVIGSFLNVCILRLPAKESLMSGSHCTSCGHRLRWYDLFPLFSYLFLKGRCRYCKTKISAQYPLVEGINALFYMVVFAVNGVSFLSVLYCLMTSALLVLSVVDWRTYEIPLSCSIFLLGLGIAACVLDFPNIMGHLIGLLVVSAALYLLYLLSGGRAIGGGDVKLMGAAGLLLGAKLIVLAFFLGCILGSVIHVLRIRLSGAGRVLAMGPYLSAGIFISALWGNRMIEWYLGPLM